MKKLDELIIDAKKDMTLEKNNRDKEIEKAIKIFYSNKEFFIAKIENNIISAIKKGEKSVDIFDSTIYWQLIKLDSTYKDSTNIRNISTIILGILLDELNKEYRVIRIFEEYGCIILNSKSNYFIEYINHYRRIKRFQRL